MLDKKNACFISWHKLCVLHQMSETGTWICTHLLFIIQFFVCIVWVLFIYPLVFQDFPKICPKTEEICKGLCHNQIRCQPIDYLNDYDLLYEDNFCLELKNNIKWYKILNTREIFEIFDMIADSQTYKLVAGNTAHGKRLTEFLLSAFN